MEKFKHKIGDRVVVEVTGTVVVRQEGEYGSKYIVRPDDSRASAIHADPRYVFPEDDEPEICAEVIPFPPRQPLPSCLAEMVEADVA